MWNIFKKIGNFILSHKIVSIILIIVIVAGSWYGIKSFNKNQDSVKYVVAPVEKGTLVVSVSGTGQVLSSNEVTLSAKTSGEVTYLGASVGDEVISGKLLLTIDTADAQQAIKDAQASYDLAVLSLNKLKEPIDELTLMQAEDAVISAQNSKTNLESSLAKAYEDGFNSVSNAFLDLPDVMSGLYDVIYGNGYHDYQGNADYYAAGESEYSDKAKIYKQDVFDKYAVARSAYNENLENYKKTNRYSSADEIESLINETYETNKAISDAIKSANNLIQFYKDYLAQKRLTPNNLVNTHLTSLNNYTSKTNSILSNLLSIKQTIQNNKDSLKNADRTILEKQMSLEKTKAGPTDLELKSQELAVEQKYNALLTAQENLNNCYVRAPFSGTVAKINVTKGNSVSNGAALITFISKGKIINVSLNEVDISKVKIGDSVNLTFDALPELTLTGKVVEVDAVGTVTSGVVNYNVKISFDDETGQVKPGMTASASIITEAKTDVLLVPNSAVKSAGESYYVEVPELPVEESLLSNTKGIILTGGIQKKAIEIGLANDFYTEVISGLIENEQVISSTIKNSSTAKSSTAAVSSSASQSAKTNSNSGGNMIMPGLGGPPN